MAHAIDLTNKKFGRLTVLERVNIKHKSRKALWKCLCECGNQTNVTSDKLQSGDIKSCGCLRTDKGKAVQTYNENHLRKDGVFTPLLKSKLRVDNSTGVKGVYAIKNKNSIKYKALITVNKKTIYLGSFDTIEEAKRARKQGELRYHQPYLKENEYEF